MVSAVTKRIHPVVEADYDRLADVLYLSLGPPKPDEGENTGQGVVLRFSMDDNSPSGVTVIHFKRLRWPDKIGVLSDIIAKHLRVSERNIKEVINSVVPKR